MSEGPNEREKTHQRVVMRIAAWPTEDQAIWEAAVSPADPFEDAGGERAAMRFHSNKRLSVSYGRWLNFLSYAGELAGSPASRIRKDLVGRYVKELQLLGNLPSTISLRLADLLLMARLCDNSADWSFIKKLAERVRALPSSPKGKRSTLRGSDELFDLGIQLMEQAKIQLNPIEAATLHRDGLMIALLALLPLRSRNFVQLRLGIELNFVDGGWVGHLNGQSTKNHSPFEFVWPEVLVDALEHYLEVHRPLLLSRCYRWLQRANDHLWVAQSGSAVTQSSFYCIITKRTKAAFGHAINPHAFRHAAATTLAIHDPKHVRIAGPLLGHRTQGIAETYYNQAISLDAHRDHLKALADLRTHSRRPKT